MLTRGGPASSARRKNFPTLSNPAAFERLTGGASGSDSWGAYDMQYMLLIYEDERIYGADKKGPEIQAIAARHMAFAQGLGSVRLGGAGLKAAALATTVRTEGGTKTIHDGPFAETKEQLGGYYLIDVPDLDAAIEIARKVPISKDGSVEVRPLLGGG
jgi:hypothetical protein